MRPFRLSVAAHRMQQWGQQKRDAYISDLFDAFEKLSATPQIAAIADEIRKGYQKFLQGSHIIFFQVCELHSIEIIRVLHKRMDADAQLNSL